MIDDGVVYFLQEGDVGPIKIGFTTDLTGRIKTLQTSNSKQLNLILDIPGNKDIESFLHKKFIRDKVKEGGGDEWYHPSFELTNFIKNEYLKRINQFKNEIKIYENKIKNIIPNDGIYNNEIKSDKKYNNYFGEHKDRKPNGFGIIDRRNVKKEDGEIDFGQENEIGNFVDGLLDGWGVIFNNMIHQERTDDDFDIYRDYYPPYVLSGELSNGKLYGLGICLNDFLIEFGFFKNSELHGFGIRIDFNNPYSVLEFSDFDLFFKKEFHKSVSQKDIINNQIEFIEIGIFEEGILLFGDQYKDISKLLERIVKVHE